MDRNFGFVSDETGDAPDTLMHWDGSIEHYQVLIKHGLREIFNDHELDYGHLISGGGIDSLGIVSVITLIEQVFNVNIDLASVQHNDFESIEKIYDRFIRNP